VGLERGPLSLVSKIEELLGINSSGSGLENREYGRGNSLCWPRETHYAQKLALTSPTSGGRSVGIVRLRNKATEFLFLVFFCMNLLFLITSRYIRKHAPIIIRNISWYTYIHRSTIIMDAFVSVDSVVDFVYIFSPCFSIFDVCP
jgi:hypothetical protein